ncbi:uncharacterized protein THITE_2113725 [Thermothielavioides terrestris NRRL 8126]|uniref:DUF202 domain-containing protein n=1 Tax=Thermothielavioides terrestris (strain ATCC 38088 / NRRL 8126) TaxID=578455 RepID=G2R3V7_THETT|nr:uncharacterized protein THITE_2113725 [Thermothielavioides terrestris NRRL 8126]AEO66012.1 hypothetical protein THITE_2113725 [Thermothielavioides terrestris NRRL 8126]
MASMLEALQPHPEDRLHLRLHRARSVVLTSQELVEIRAAQRTFEGAYMRTALSQFSFALVVLRIFTSEFYPIGALLACYGAAVLLVAIYRRYEGNRQFFDCEESEGSSAEEEEVVEEGAGAGAQVGRRRASAFERGPRQLVVKKKFRTSSNSVGLLVGLSLVSYVALVVLLWQLA